MTLACFGRPESVLNMRIPTSVSLEPEVREDGKILASLNNHESFSDYVNELIKREAEVERFRIEEAKKLRRTHAPQTSVY